MLRTIDLDGLGPLYQQVARAIAAAVRAGGLGDRLPSTRELAEQLGLSRNTVRAAYELLGVDGLIVARRGAGSFATTPAAPPDKEVRAAATPPRSKFAKRCRDAANAALSLGRLHHGLRFNLQYGEPATDVLFSDVWRRELGKAAALTTLGYPDSQGMYALRKAICQHLWRRRGLHAKPDDVLVVFGTQQALSLAARVLLDEGDRVVLENPCYFFAREVMHAHGARIVAVDVDRHGLVTTKLPVRRAALVCVTPSHQFPLGVVLAPPRRAALLDYARRHDAWILEDDYDAEFRYDARRVPPLKADDADDRVIHVGSFSKALAPALRLGYVVMPRALRSDFVAAKRLADLGCPAIEQAALAHLLASGAFERHMRRVMNTLTKRRTALMTGLARHVGNRLKVVDSGAGMHLLAFMPHTSEAQEAQLIDAARQIGIGLHPLSGHYVRGRRPRGLLLGYAGLAPPQIDAACKALGRCLSRL